ncbi:UDP-glucose 4-epimerase [Trinickia violacea]|uniref:UDP-glucose 4-epimerase n=1 Tax=Trinickia violacea TaxID=2571746 RepID=A0A4P8IQI4_9BURK|nr:UDP-glucose 4-epimerase [Trinickia violacea]QCP49885.1 UDP-glucose 4-epimerase [Trinickia violacea]
MTMSGKVGEGDWSVSAEVKPVAGGFVCTVHVDHDDPKGKFEHQFKHHTVFATERDAVLEGLREGMVWIEQKRAHSIHL